MNKNITLEKPWVLDITSKFDKQLKQFDGSVEKLKEFYKKFGYDTVPYSGQKRWGLDSSTDSSDITYGDIEIGHELYMRKYTANGFRFIVIKVIHKYGGIIFFETLGEKKNKRSYIDTGANDFEWTGSTDSRFSLPKHIFYPIGVVKPSWVDISEWNAPKSMKVTNKE